MSGVLDGIELGPWIGGTWDWGLRKARSNSREILVATTAPHAVPLEDLRARFMTLATPTVLAVGTHEAEHHRVDILVEACPDGRPSTDVTIDPVRALELLAAAARQIEVLHTSGLVVGSLRPELVYVDDTNTITGVAPFSEMFFRNIAMGSVGIRYPFDEIYMAPELVRGTAVGPAADVFGVAACLLRWIFGRYPFAGNTFMERVMALAEARVSSAIDLTRVPSFIRDALSAEPTARPPLSAFF